MWTEHQIQIGRQQLALDGCAPGENKLHELLRWCVDQQTIRVVRRSLFQNVGGNIFKLEDEQKCLTSLRVVFRVKNTMKCSFQTRITEAPLVLLGK